MSHSHKTTPIVKIKREESPGMEQELMLANLDNFRCEIHPQFKVDALNVNRKTNSITLHCIKCIINGDGTRGGEENLITIKELLHKCHENLLRNKTNILRSRDGLNDIFLGFFSRDYIGIYEKHLETQLKVVDDKFEDLISKLTILREKYKNYYIGEIGNLREQGSEIKDKVDIFFENKRDEEIPQYTSIHEIYDKFNSITKKEELETFLQELHLKSIQNAEDVTETDDCRRVLGLVDSIKQKVRSINDNQIDLSTIEDMNRNLESLLQPESASFKKSVRLIGKVHNIDFSNHSFGNSEHKRFDMLSPEQIYEGSNGYHSPRLRERETPKTIVKNRNYNNQETTKKKKKVTENGLDSQALRNIKKEIEKKEGMEEEFDDDHDIKGSDDKLTTYLCNWINRRITGYLLFQNTMNSSASDKDKGISETGVHLNHTMGTKWKALTEREKQEYKNLALQYRAIFKREVEEKPHKTKDLLEEFDEKIKKIKMH